MKSPTSPTQNLFLGSKGSPNSLLSKGMHSPLGGGMGRASSFGKTFTSQTRSHPNTQKWYHYALTSMQTTWQDFVRLYRSQINASRDVLWSFLSCFFGSVCSRGLTSALCVYRYSLQPKFYRVVRGPGHSDEGHPGGSENEGADPEGTAATSPAGHGSKAVRPQFSGPQQLQSWQG